MARFSDPPDQSVAPSARDAFAWSFLTVAIQRAIGDGRRDMAYFDPG
jgi:hypothetical protein